MIKDQKGLTQGTIVILMVAVILGIILVVWISQLVVEQNALSEVTAPGVATLKEQREIDKLAAEIRQIRSDTAGSLFWLKLIGVFVTVGGAVGGYLVGQSRATQARMEFEDRKNVDTAYQSIVQELSTEDQPVLRAAAAVKLGAIMKDFPKEWFVSEGRRAQIVRLTKDVLAAALAIETDVKVLKMITIAIAQHQPWRDQPEADEKSRYGDMRGLDLSLAKANGAYWARVDLTYADLYLADLSEASLRAAILHGTQMRETDLTRAVLVGADCLNANFKLADLKNADLSGAMLTGASFEGAKVFGVTIDGALFGDNPETVVDTSEKGDGSALIPVSEWIAGQQD